MGPLEKVGFKQRKMYYAHSLPSSDMSLFQLSDWDTCLCMTCLHPAIKFQCLIDLKVIVVSKGLPSSP